MVKKENVNNIGRVKFGGDSDEEPQEIVREELEEDSSDPSARSQENKKQATVKSAKSKSKSKSNR